MTIKRTKLKNDVWKPAEKCAYASPYICYQSKDRGWYIQQSCCNHWDCPRCGTMRAKEEYARIVEGARALDTDGKKLYFWTMTCRGKELSKSDAEKGYLTWTHKLLDSASHKANRAAEFWCYVQVTERQKRGHPHSHMITTYVPPDAVPYAEGELLPNNRYARHDTLWSEWFIAANVRAGLGEECEISAVRTPEAVSRYIGKYMFKQTINDTWPKGWKRVRYSQNWPDLPDVSNPTAFPVIKFYDWMRVLDIHEPIRADSICTYKAAQARGVVNVKPPAW